LGVLISSSKFSLVGLISVSFTIFNLVTFLLPLFGGVFSGLFLGVVIFGDVLVLLEVVVEGPG